MKDLYEIAGLIVVLSSFGRIKAQAEPYGVEAEKEVDMEVRSNWEKVKEKYPYLSDDDGEYIFSGESFYRQLLDFDGIMLHSSCVVVDDRAYLFSADSGTGKSTHTGLWLKKFGERAFILNDDKPALRLENGEWYAYGTPWSGKNDISVNARVKVAGIAMLERGAENRIERFGGKEAIFEIYKQVNRPKGTEYRLKILKLLDRLLTDVPLWKLTCNMDLSAVDVSYGAMSAPEKDSEC